jgi:hypothetical protein
MKAGVKELRHLKGFPIMRRRRLWSAVLGILLSLAVSLIIAAWPGSSTFTVGKETTYITGPLDKHGYPDYVTALNQRIGKGITPENNANVLIWQAIGPKPEGATLPDEYFRWLGIAPPPEDGEYLVSWDKYRKQRLQKFIKDNPDYALPTDVPTKPWSANDFPEIADWLEQNKKPLALVIEATRRTEYFNPLVPRRTEDWSPGLIGALLPSTQRCREIASALVCRAMLRVSEGNKDEAWQDLLACHRLGRLTARGATLVELLVGIAIEGVASKGDVEFIEHSKLTSKQFLACLDDLRRVPPISAIADCINVNERFMTLDLCMLMARHGTEIMKDLLNQTTTQPRSGNQFTDKLFTRSINWDPALRTAHRWFDRYVEALRIKDPMERMREIKEIKEDVNALKRHVEATALLQKTFMDAERRGEWFGDLMIGLMFPGYDKVNSSAERIEQVQRNLHLAFALAAYHSDHGRYPAKLDELVPKYLEKIPDDLFSGKALIYRVEDDGYLLYSVGPNGVDDDGRGYDDQPRGDDISIRMPVPVPQKDE